MMEPSNTNHKRRARPALSVDEGCHNKSQGHGLFLMNKPDSFICHGTYCCSNAGGFEIQLSDCGQAARMKDAYGSANPEISGWKSIEFVFDRDDPENPQPVIDPDGYNIPLSQVMRNHT